jgi:hypothetical protein
MKQTLCTIILFGWTCTLLAVTATPHTTPEATYTKTLAEAKQAYQQATQRNNAWRDTKKLLQSAEKAAKAGDYTQAQQLAATAKQQGLNAVQQHDSQIGIGNPDYLH